jgi:hypothetical protein
MVFPDLVIRYGHMLCVSYKHTDLTDILHYQSPVCPISPLRQGFTIVYFGALSEILAWHVCFNKLKSI